VPSYRRRPDRFPINILRNIGIGEVQTTHYFMTDMDFWPSRFMYRRLRRLARSDNSPHRYHFQHPFRALVVPAFAMREYVKSSIRYGPEDVPENLVDLRTCLRKHRCEVFKFRCAVGGPRCEMPTHCVMHPTTYKPGQRLSIPQADVQLDIWRPWPASTH
jgi:hypothetical protein